MEDSSLNKYLDDIGREQLLTAAQERELSTRIKAGDERALNKLVEANLRFVVKVAGQYRGQGLPLDDLISEGNIGLMKAAAKFDVDRGTPFVNYSVVFVRQQIERAISAQNGLSKMPADVAKTDKSSTRVRSVDAPLNGRANMSLLSVLVNQDAPATDARVYSEAIENAIEFALLSLSEREVRVVNAFFGINQEHETMAEIAEDLDLKRERVRQIRDKAVRKIRKAYKRKLQELRK